jgi:tRNA nucleotidyltransferase (CCA-adding enzyme)
MVPELCEAAKHPEIKNALINKISRERIGIEFEKMITGPYPLLSLCLIHQLELYPVIMAPPPVIKSGVIGDDILAVNTVGVVTWLVQHHFTSVSEEEKRILILTASVIPYYHVVSETKKKVLPAVQLVLRESIKTNNTDVATVSTLFRGIDLFQEMVKLQDIKRSQLGMLIRDLGSLWKTTLKMTIAKEMLDSYSTLDWTKDQNVDIGKDIYQKYNELLLLAEKYGISDCFTWKHMVDGKRAAQIVGLKPGPVVTELLKVQMIWQLDHPQGTKEECEEAIKYYWENKN